MMLTSRWLLLAAGLLAFPLAGAMAQQSNSPGNGAALKSTTSGDPHDARTTTSNAGSTLKTETMGDSGKKVTPPTDSAAATSPRGASTGPTGKQPQ